MSEHLLHPELIDQIPLNAGLVHSLLADRIEESVIGAENAPETTVSVVIRSRNNASQIEGLFADIRAQYAAHEPEIIVVDTESDDGTPELACREGATVLSISQSEFSYPKALNMGFDATSNEWVLSLVDHSALSHKHILSIARRWNCSSEVAGISGSVYPSSTSSRTERLAAAAYAPWSLRSPYDGQTRDRKGLLAANCSFFRRVVWKELGGFDESYAAGGEDNAMARAMLDSGNEIVVDPALVVFHSHGLGPINCLRQFRYWQSLTNPLPFDDSRLAQYRPGMDSQ